MNQGLRWYLISTGFYLVPGGIQMVLFPWLVAIFLEESATRVGIAQMASQLPMLFLILWGGLLGDRVDQRRLLIILQAIMILPPLVMAALVQADLIIYEVLLVLAVISGAIGAFVQPARDALLSRVAGQDIQRVVTLVIGIQFGIQILGFAAGSMVDVVGPTVVMCLQAVILFAAVVATAKIPPLAPAISNNANLRSHAIREIADGLVIAWNSAVIRPTIVMTFAIGLFFAGAYMVILPLMVRNLYNGDAAGIAMAFAANMAGTCTTIFFLMRRGGLDRPGRALIICGLFSCFILSILYLDLPQWGFYLVIYIWGLCAGISMPMTRAIVQEASPDSHKARLMSVYSLGMMGGMPLGSLLLGFCVEYLGVRAAVLVSVAGMLVVLFYLCTSSKLWQIRRGSQL